MTGLVIGGIVVILALATAIKAVCVVGPLLDENAALRRANKDQAAAYEDEMRNLRMKVSHAEILSDRMKQIASAAWKHGDRLYARLEKYEPCEDKPSDDPDYFDYLDDLEAEASKSDDVDVAESAAWIVPGFVK